MEFVSDYVAKQPDARGMVTYNEAENQIWATLYRRQIELLPGLACDEFLQGLAALQLDCYKIPQLPEVNSVLSQATGWQVEPVAALISAEEFFQLLSTRRFPTATFIRSQKELNYIKEPDIFHELFGHCPMLLDPIYADFLQDYALKVLDFDKKDWPLLQRLFWFTVEFGLIRSKHGFRAYGGGILSSIEEIDYSVNSELPLRVYFSPLTAFRTPYRIDMLQKVYFVIDSYQQLYDFVHTDIESIIAKARQLGEFPPLFPVELNNPSVHVMVC